MKNYLNYIIKYMRDKNLEKKIKAFGKVKYDLPLIKSFVLEIALKDKNLLHSMCDPKLIYKNTNITAQINTAKKTVNADFVNRNGYTGKNINICLLDTGISNLKDFIYPKNRIIFFKDFINNKEQPYDDNGHGTHVAGIIAGNGFMSNKKYSGIAPDANIICLKILDSEGKGNSADVLAGLQWIADNQKKFDIKIVNLSVGAKDDGSDDPLINAVEKLWDSGVSVVIAAGNNGPEKSSVTSPGTSKKVITVGASDDHKAVNIFGDSLINFSGRGPTLECVIKPDVIAPGANIISCRSTEAENLNPIDNNYAIMSGTSMSTPIITGAIALLLEKNPNLTPNQIKLKLKKSTIDLNYSQNQQGWGLIDVKKFVFGD